MNRTELALRKEIVRVGKLLFELEYTSGTGGNVSARLGSAFLITPSKVNKGFLAPNDVVAINARGAALSGKRIPSSETLMHLEVFRTLPQAGAAIHAHPPYATACAIRGESIETSFVPEALVFLGPRVPLVPYATPSTRQMAGNLRALLSPKCPAYLLQNHGVLVWGKTLQDAFNNLQTLELYAMQLTICRLVGRPKAIPKSKLAQIKKLFDL